MDAGKTGAPPPWALVKAWLCQFYGCTPGQLAQEEADEILLLYNLSGTYEEWRKKRPGFGGNKPKIRRLE